MSTQWSAPDEHGTSTAAVTREDGVQTQWSRDKHGWTTPVSGADSEQQLTDAGYGDDRRQRYIDESGQDPGGEHELGADHRWPPLPGNAFPATGPWRERHERRSYLQLP